MIKNKNVKSGITNIPLFFLPLFFWAFSYLTAQNICVNEVMSSNSFYYDEDGDTPDWIELYNNGSDEISLEGFALSDDSSNPFQWQFPDISLAPEDFLFVFASDKDRKTAYWENIIDWGDEWKYFVGNEEPPLNWREIDFDDSDWSAGPSGFGFGDGDDATIIPLANSCYIRHSFTIDDLNDLYSSLLHIDYDDAFVAYLNGIEVARNNILSPGIIPAYDDSAATSHEAKLYQNGNPETFFLDGSADILLEGSNVLAIQVHNEGVFSNDLSLIPFFSLGFSSEPANAVGVPTILEELLPFLHTNFKIDADGEMLLLSAPNGAILNEIILPELETDISFGRQPDGSDNWFYFDHSTPDSSNVTNGFQQITPQPVIQPIGGFFENEVSITFYDVPAFVSIYYSLDGSLPDSTHNQYSSAIQLDSTAVIRARAFAPGEIPSKIITQTYFLDQESDLPIISLATDPENLWDDEIGIYALGNNANPNYPYFGANFWQDWERPIHIEMYETGRSNAFSLNAGVKIFGNYSRVHPQKSLAIFARNSYDDVWMEHQIFPDKAINSFKNIVLRNSGNDWEYTMFRDMLMTGLTSELDIDRQAYRPAIVFLNGEYWGIHNIREKVNEHYLAANHSVDPDNIDLLENNRIAIHGDGIHYQALLDFIENNNVALSQNYEYIKTQMNVENFIKYWNAQIFFLNGDWPHRNIKYWRERVPDGKWEWILFDTDFGFDLWQSADHNFLAELMNPNGPSGNNYEWSTFLFRSLLENETFKNDFINYAADLLNSCFNTSFVLDRIDQFQAILQNEMQTHKMRWQQSYDLWLNEVLILQYFANERPEFVREHFISEFDLTGTAALNIDIFPIESGEVQINSLQVDEFPWSGNYFQNIPIILEGLENPGWEFAGWTGDIISDSISITLEMTADQSLIAWFEPVTNFTDSIVFNEINYNSDPDFDPEDWIELFNRSQQNIDLSGWKFADSNDSNFMILPEGTILSAENYLVLCRDSTSFFSHFPNVSNVLGNWDFGLSGSGECIRLFNQTNALIDSVEYDDDPPWPTDPDGNGPTLSLLNPDLENSLVENWAASSNYGTPGEINDIYIFDQENIIQKPVVQLFQNYPNPFNPTTTICFNTQPDKKTEIIIYNLKGQLIKILDFFNPLDSKEIDTSSTKSVIWNGRDQYDKPVGSGVYFYQMKIDGQVIDNRKMLLLK